MQVSEGTVRRLVLDIASGEICCREQRVTAANHRAYAERCGADFVELIYEDAPHYAPAAKWLAPQYAADYDQTLVMDTDCIVTRKGYELNIFDEVKFGWWGLVDELHQWEGARNFWQTQADGISAWCDLPRERLKWAVNSGVMLMPNNAATAYGPPPKDVPWVWATEQLWLSMELMRSNTPVHLLDPRWNWTYFSGGYVQGQPEAFIIHQNDPDKECRHKRCKEVLEKFA